MSARITAILAALCSAAPALAYQQTTANGRGLHWPTNSVTFAVNTSRPNSAPSCGVTGASDPALDAVNASFGAWTKATRPGDTAPCTGLSLLYGGTSSSITVGADSSTHLVVFRQGWCSNNAQAQADTACQQTDPPSCDNKYNCFEDVGSMSQNVLALTTVLYQPSTGVIGDADMEVVDWDGTAGTIQQPPAHGWYWTCSEPTGAACTTYGQGGCYFMDLQNTVTHEAGHFIGLAHPCETDRAAATANGVPLCTGGAMAQTTMYPSAGPGETLKRSLSSDDVDGVCAIYGAASPHAGSKSSSGGCGSGSATPAGLAALALALAVLLPRGRRRTR